LRVIGGSLRGRRLFAPEGDDTRPTASRVREALFDILGERVWDSRFLDLFAGTGAVGIEALSRGARSVVFVERAGSALQALRRNLEAVGAGGRAEVVAAAAERALGRLAGQSPPFDLAFADPPYAAAERDRILELLGDERLWARGATLVVEHAVRDAPPLPPGFEQGRSYRYGDTGLAVFHRPAPEP